MKQTICDALLKRGAKLEQLASPVNMVGLGDASIPSLGLIHADLQLKDDVKRRIIAHVCKECPFDLIIGLDFMQDEQLGCFPNPTGLEICSKGQLKSIEQFYHVNMRRPRRAEPSDQVKEYKKLVTQDRASRRQRWIEQQSQDKKNFLELLSSVRLREGVTEAEFQAAAARVPVQEFHVHSVQLQPRKSSASSNAAQSNAVKASVFRSEQDDADLIANLKEV